jgi:hypothetical protein
MTYRVSYNGIDVEESTLNGAIEYAKSLIANDAGTVTAWRVEHDELINDWFVQGTLDGEPIAYTATVVGPDSVGPVEESRLGEQHHGTTGNEEGADRVRSKSFGGQSPAEVFGRATAWLAGQPTAVVVADVGWHYLPNSPEPLDLTIYYYLA